MKLPGTLALCAALMFGAVAAGSDATPTPAPDPAILARAKTAFVQLQAGKVDRTQLDTQANADINDATIKRAQSVVGALGTPVTFEQANVFTRNGITLYVYLVTFGGGQSLDFGYALDAAGKVASLQILPGPGQ